MRSMTRDEVVDALTTHPDSPYRRSTLDGMTDDEVAAAVNSAGLSFDDLRAAADRAEAGGVEVDGVLSDPPSDDGARNRGGRGADLATLRRSFAPLAAGGPAGNVGDGADVEVRSIMSGPRGEAALDGEDARAEARARREAADNRREREAARRRGEVPVETQGILSGPRGDAAVDD